jgi:hypothetical protein
MAVGTGTDTIANTSGTGHYAEVLAQLLAISITLYVMPMYTCNAVLVPAHKVILCSSIAAYYAYHISLYSVDHMCTVIEIHNC